jgi:hypothetical protein
VIATGSDPEIADMLRGRARTAGLIEITGLDAAHAVAMASTTTFAEIYRLEPSSGWLRTWRLRDGLLVSAVRLSEATCGLPSRELQSRAELVMNEITPRYSQARRYLREVNDEPPGPATACFEAEGQCFIEPATGKPSLECEP